MRTTVDWRDGWLCIRAEYTENDKPVIQVLWWPVYKCIRRDAEHLIGLRAQGGTSGVYAVQLGLGFCGQWLDLALLNGRQTKAIAMDQIPVHCPKVRKGIPTRYTRGRWEKQLKTGWTSA
jgi:hypothetical protein